MIKSEIQQTVAYIKDLTESLYEWDDGVISWQIELPKLHETIAGLMQASAESDDADKRLLLAKLEYEARKCRNCILRRTAVRN